MKNQIWQLGHTNLIFSLTSKTMKDLGSVSCNKSRNVMDFRKNSTKFYIISSHLKNLNLTFKVGLQWILSKYILHIMTFNSYLIYKYQHFPLLGVTKQSVHSSLFFTPFPKFFWSLPQFFNLLKTCKQIIILLFSLLEHNWMIFEDKS